MHGHQLLGVLVRNLPPGRRPPVGSTGQLERQIVEMVRRGRSAWPNLPLAPERFVAFLASKVPEADSLNAAMRSLRAPDLYLACALLDGLPQAVEALEQLMSSVRSALARLGTGGVLPDEVLSTIRADLLSSRAGRPARLAGYNGACDLRQWLQVVAVRTALGMLPAHEGESEVADEVDLIMARAATLGSEQEILFLCMLCQREFQAAFLEALRSLSARERNLLRFRVLDRLSFEQIGALLKVPHEEIVPWFATLNRKLAARTRDNLVHRLDTSRSEIDSLTGLLERQLAITTEVSVKESRDRR